MPMKTNFFDEGDKTEQVNTGIKVGQY